MLKYSKLSHYKIKKLIKLFDADIVACKAAYLLELNRKTVDTYYHYFRELIAQEAEKNQQALDGDVEIDVLYSSTIHHYEILGMINERKEVIVSKLIKRTFLDYSQALFQHVHPGSTILTSKKFFDYNFSTLGYKHCQKDNKETELLYKKKCLLKTIQLFSNYAARRLRQFNGAHRHDNYLYLKECEVRFGCAKNRLYCDLCRILKINPR